MDNFHTLPELFEMLIKNKSDAYATVSSNRINLLDSFAKEKLKRGEVTAWHKGKMMALWRKDVCIMSTGCNGAFSVVKTKGGKDVRKPNFILGNNNTNVDGRHCGESLSRSDILSGPAQAAVTIVEDSPSSVCGMRMCCFCRTALTCRQVRRPSNMPAVDCGNTPRYKMMGRRGESRVVDLLSTAILNAWQAGIS